MASVRKRSWKITTGEAKTAWIVDYADNRSAVNNSEAVERESDFGALVVLGSPGFGT
jgi:hypothetical protein